MAHAEPCDVLILTGQTVQLSAISSFDLEEHRVLFSAWLQTPLNIEDEISESESDSDSSRQADNWDSSSLDSANEHRNSGEDTSSAE